MIRKIESFINLGVYTISFQLHYDEIEEIIEDSFITSIYLNSQDVTEQVKEDSRLFKVLNKVFEDYIEDEASELISDIEEN